MTANDLFSLALTILFGALISGTPLLFATIGEIFSERAGVMNLGIEGMMLIGAMSGFAVWFNTGSLLFGLLAGMLLGGMLALLHAFITITLRADQVVSGLAVTLLGGGLSSILGQPYVGQRVPVPLTLNLPLLGNIAAQHLVLITLGLIFAVLAWLYVNRTRPDSTCVQWENILPQQICRHQRISHSIYICYLRRRDERICRCVDESCH
jgi:simple sugar transport system permease protein